MGCCVSRIDRQEMVSRCKARKKYIKHLVLARQSLSVSHSFYLRSLRATGASLLHFATGESSLHHHHHLNHRPLPPPLPMSPSPPLPPTPPPPPSISPSTDTWTTTTASTTTNATPLPPPPPPPPPPCASSSVGSTWDFWDPFAAEREGRDATTEEEWEEATTEVTEVRVAANVGAAASVVSGYSKEESEMAVVVSRQGKELVEIIKELDHYFLTAADAAAFVSGVLEVPSFVNHHHRHLSSSGNNGRSMNWSPMLWGGGGKLGGLGLGKLGEECGMVVGRMGMINGNGGVNNVINGTNNNTNNNGGSHCATLERLYAWEKKLFHEVKNAEKLRMEHEKRVEQLRRLEVKRADYMKTEKTKKEVEKLESLLEVASQAIQTTSDEIIRLRESDLYPQLLDLIKGFMCMWRSMYECHQVQMHIVDQLKLLNPIPSNEPTSEIHRQSTLQLEAELQQWHQSFTNLVKAQRDYIHSLTGWLRLSLFQFNKNPLMRSIQDSSIYSLCELWQVQIDHVPDKVASEGIKSLLTVVHAIVVQQAEEHKQKKRSENANRDLEKRAAQLRSLEGKYGPYSLPEMSGTRNGKDPVGDKRAKVDMLKNKAEEEKAKHEKAVGVTRAMTLNNIQMGLPHVFQAITGFSSVCTQSFEKVYNEVKVIEQDTDVKRLMA
ncbi:protein ALTERED PHOSPHATE STARVATION RESPONSE 1-like [Silene latifolia]|uniref:protein ALTERED PHOSPHATE STARVATION RESPONSE 1-like n=1 Tax=Silene latifolia TaxID=37657 RepID=UPI003D770192